LLEGLESWARKLPAALEAWRQAEHERIDAEYRQRKLESAGGMTALRQLINERKRFEERRDAERKARAMQRRARLAADRPPPLVPIRQQK
jgi:hypothetical protein